MRKIGAWVVYALVFFAAISCVSNEKVIYLQNLENNQPINEGELISYEIPEYRLQYNDIIDVNIQTAEDMLQSGFGNKVVAGNNQMQMAAQSGGDIYYMTGYTVDKNGFIRLPIIGEVQVKDKTIDEARVIIESKLREFLKNELYVKVKLGGIRYSALGEFRRPGKFVVLQDRMTIFEAIANAGDLTTVAKRDEVLLIRQYPEGTKLHRINLNDRSIIQSPFYFIQPNDQLYVEPMKVREVGAGENAAQSLSLIISAITVAVLLINTFTR
ncbi:MAG TPA: sugar transporter [Algoriphagus sp.]|jgi:polysaccharide export outer membrane protein|uniref:polysaccharide biosynthesis/export family protein n=2 Tax=Algoriphagus TaxID=246875 RepID=UPI000C37D3D2|nr:MULTISPECIES: polysaccharide biosynthesis/export family protein [unclassified Algoriphagus]MAL13408.1 sugar transporter [Algoriphagus sp.]MAN87979.1 sugar transporter [Algoriphagus sp.]HAD51220.1 sugar transporter [Algoriphagus sp.]HAZ24827.1 sugar transporter [Algoriphagus sp.]HCB47560.1 sugar transporter [Algoriphagus sp.]|tara:strand:- start:213 stop:1022 length:810 start_codon:yes stop_codon:yes gene_type:complete